METITLTEARSFALFAQGLLQPPSQAAQLTDVKSVISRLGVLQIDTINIVARSPYFSMWSRLGDYNPAWIDQLLEKKGIFECWAHVASFLPIEDFPLHRRLVLERLRLPWYQNWYNEHKSESDAILEYVKEHGAVRSSDFKRKDGERAGTWWNWKLEKRALEYWFAAGELMISKRTNFQRVYDLTQRVMPDWKDSDAPDLETVYQQLVIRSISAMGFVLPSWVADYFRLPKNMALAAFQKLIDNKQLVEIKVADWSESAWALPETWEAFQNEISLHPDPQYTILLTPFDSLIWDRQRTSRLFNFDFSIECYLPASKRKYGYFLLPVLHNGQLIARLDAKAHRGEKKFEVKSLYLEPSIKPNKNLAASVASTLANCAAWHKTPELSVSKSDPQEFHEMIQKAIR